MMSLISKSIKELTPAVIAYEEAMSPEELDAFLNSVLSYVNSSKVFKTLFTVVIVITVYLPLFTRGRLFFWLSGQEKEEFLNELISNPNELLRGVGTLVSVPIKMVYYNREDEMKRLGYDAQALKQDAQLRNVTRTRNAQKGCEII